jgi:hypothetical protein
MGQLIAFMFKIATQDIAKNKCPEIPDMREIPNCRAAHIQADLVALKRVKLLDLP